MKVSVTSEHIEGAISDPAHCPIAQALTDAASGRNLEFTVWSQVILQHVPGHPYLVEEWELSEILQKKVYDFDIGKGMEPFEFEFPMK